MDPIKKYFGRNVMADNTITRLVTFAQYEARALKSSLEKEEIKHLRCYLTQNLDQYRNIYEMICHDQNNERALTLIRICAPLVYARKGSRTISHATETWKKSVLVIDYGNADIKKSVFRLHFSALELIFMRAGSTELRAIIAYLVDDTKKMVDFSISEWVYKGSKI